MSEKPEILSKSIQLLEDLINSLENNKPIKETTKENKNNKKTTTNQKQQNNNTEKNNKKQTTTTTNKPSSSKQQTNKTVDLFATSCLVVGQIESVKAHPESEKLYQVTLNIGTEQRKNVLAGLRKFYSEEELKDRKVIAIINLKPRKLAGMLSEAMLLAGSTITEDNVEKVKLLEVPEEGVSIGERIILENDDVNNYVPQETICKKWEDVVKGLKVLENKPTFNGRNFITSNGKLTCKCELPNGSEIH
ncbi:hypothetical protein ABK040_013912 [Willaertia magna]